MSTPISEWLHEHLHRLPGLPPHSEADRLNQNPGAQRRSASDRDLRRPALTGRHPALPNRDGHHAKPPQVLVAWQNWIGRLFARRVGRR